MDLPEVIDLRRYYISETDRRQFISKSVFDISWYNEITNKNHVMLLIAGVLYYFDEHDIKKLINDFHTFLPGIEIIFDYASKKGVKISNKKVIEKGGMNKNAFLKWGCENIIELEKWESYIKVLHKMPMYKEYKKNYTFLKRIGMSFVDSLKIMSLAHIKIY